MTFEIPRETIFDSKEFEMDNLRKEWREQLKKVLSKLVEPANVICELTREHPDQSYLREDMIQVLCGNSGAYISTDEYKALSKLYELLQPIGQTSDNIDDSEAFNDTGLKNNG